MIVRGRLFNRGASRQQEGKPVRLAVAGKGCALNISNGWLLLAPIPEGLEIGNFLVRIKEKAKINELLYSPITGYEKV